jgi:hypothetical protein
MLCAINLDDEPMLLAQKVENVAVNRRLAAEVLAMFAPGP